MKFTWSLMSFKDLGSKNTSDSQKKYFKSKLSSRYFFGQPSSSLLLVQIKSVTNTKKCFHFWHSECLLLCILEYKKKSNIMLVNVWLLMVDVFVLIYYVDLLNVNIQILNVITLGQAVYEKNNWMISLSEFGKLITLNKMIILTMITINRNHCSLLYLILISIY